MAEGREHVPWATMAAILVIARLCEPSSELHIAEDWYRRKRCRVSTLQDAMKVGPPVVLQKGRQGDGSGVGI
jgi:hypothetical protein